MKRSALFLLLLAFVLALPAQAQKLDVGVQSAIVFQALDHDNDATTPEDELAPIAPGFQNAVGNLTFDASVFDGGNVNVGIFISSKHHQETYGYEGYFQMSQLPEWMQLGRLLSFYNNHLDVRAGQMALNFGDSKLYQSVNGDVYSNELIGNPVAVPALVALGMEATCRANDLF